MVTGLTHTHSLFRWLILILLIITIIRSFSAKPYDKGLKLTSLFTLIIAHLQFLLGLGLYMGKGYSKMFGSEMAQEGILWFWTYQHIFGMLTAIILITIGYSKAKRKSDSEDKKKVLKTFFLIALILILISIPWPFREGFASYGWF